jgi:hypothetical protein
MRARLRGDLHSAKHARYFLETLGVVQRIHTGGSLLFGGGFFDTEMVMRLRSDLRQVGYAQHLSIAPE